MDDEVTYTKLKEKLILLDKNTRSWSGDGFLRNLQQAQNPTSSSSTYQGPAPMEVDQVQFGQKGKGKQKGKSKGKKGGGFGFPYGGGKSGKSYHKGKGKGRKVKTRVKENLRKARAMAAAMATMETTAACAEYVASPAIGAMSVLTGTALAKSMLVPKMLRLVKLVMVRAQQLHPCRGGRARLQQFHHRRHLQRW